MLRVGYLSFENFENKYADFSLQHDLSVGKTSSLDSDLEPNLICMATKIIEFLFLFINIKFSI